MTRNQLRIKSKTKANITMGNKNEDNKKDEKDINSKQKEKRKNLRME